nr:nematode resistance protein-like HSPRO2 [Ipomoea batatas]
MEEPEREEGADGREHTARLHPAHTGEQGKKLADHDPADTRSPLGARHCCSVRCSLRREKRADGTLARRNSSAEVWKLSDEVTVVSRTSEASLLPRLVTWRKSEDIAQNILDFIESEMRKCPGTESQPFCFRSRGLVEISKLSKDLRQNVPGILDVEVDPNGGPRVQEAAMKLYAEKDSFERIHLVQGLQAIEMGVKRFYYSYKQLLTVVMGSLEAGDSGDSLDQMKMRSSLSSHGRAKLKVQEWGLPILLCYTHAVVPRQ